MLKKKMQILAKENPLSTQNKFEIINDDRASQILGGVQDCPQLLNCGSFNGDCPNLAKCGTFGVQQ